MTDTKTMTYRDIFSMQPLDMIEWASEEFGFELPEQIQTASDMELASKLMMQITGHRSYLNELLAYAKVSVRETKRNGSKEEWEDMVDRKEILERFLKIADDAYSTLSRAVTIKTSNDREFYMNTSGSF